MKNIILSSLCLIFVSLNLQAQSIEPGVWKGKVSFKVNGIPLPDKEDDDCILPHEAKDVKASIEKNLKKQACTLTKWEVKGQNLDAALTCKGKDLDATGSLKGTFTKKSYSLKGNAKGTFKEMLPAEAEIQIIGDWVKACQK